MRAGAFYLSGKLLSGRKGDSRKTDDAAFVNVPLFVALRRSAGVRHDLHEGVEGRSAAPFQIVSIFLDQIPKASRIRGIDLLDPQLVPLPHQCHLVLVRLGRKFVTVSLAHVGHINTQYPEEALLLSLGDLSQRSKEPLPLLVLFRWTSELGALPERSAKNWKYAYVRTKDCLQKHHLEFDGVLDRMTIVLHQDSRLTR